MALHPRDLPPFDVHRRASLLEQGMHPRFLADPDLVRSVLPGWVTTVAKPASLRAVVQTLQREVIPGAVVSHETALELLEVPLPSGRGWAEGERVHCVAPRSGSARRTWTLAVHRGAVSARLRHHGMDLAPPVTALAQSARHWALDDLVIAMDSLATRRHGAAIHVPLAELTSLVLAETGRGAPSLRRAIPMVRANVWSPMETRTRLMLWRNGFPEPVNNLAVVDPATGRRFHIDLAYEKQRIAVEYDGLRHLTVAEQQADDRVKDEALHRMGWAVLRLTAQDLHEPADVLLRLRALLARQDARTPLTA